MGESPQSWLSSTKPTLTATGDHWRPIVRFDEAHGFFHRDVMLPGSEQEKVPQPALDKNLALTDAIVHIKKFWRTYRQIYEGKYEK